MKTIATQLEILLIADSSYMHREWMKKDETGKNGPLSDKDRLEEACWDGLLPEMLPEIFGKTGQAKKSYLWQTRQAKSFVDIEFGEFPNQIEPRHSLDPYSFLYYAPLN